MLVRLPNSTVCWLPDNFFYQCFFTGNFQSYLLWRVASFIQSRCVEFKGAYLPYGLLFCIAVTSDRISPFTTCSPYMWLIWRGHLCFNVLPESVFLKCLVYSDVYSPWLTSRCLLCGSIYGGAVHLSQPAAPLLVVPFSWSPS